MFNLIRAKISMERITFLKRRKNNLYIYFTAVASDINFSTVAIHIFDTKA